MQRRQFVSADWSPGCLRWYRRLLWCLRVTDSRLRVTLQTDSAEFQLARNFERNVQIRRCRRSSLMYHPVSPPLGVSRPLVTRSWPRNSTQSHRVVHLGSWRAWVEHPPVCCRRTSTDSDNTHWIRRLLSVTFTMSNLRLALIRSVISLCVQAGDGC